MAIHKLRGLAYLVTVVDHGGFNAAAQSLVAHFVRVDTRRFIVATPSGWASHGVPGHPSALASRRA